MIWKFSTKYKVFFQVLADVISSLNELLEQPKRLFAGSQLESNSSTDLLSALDTLAKNIDGVIRNSSGAGINSTDSNFQQGTPNVAFAINKTRVSKDLFLVCRRFGDNVHINITTDERQAQVTPNTLSVIKLPKQMFKYAEETLSSYYFRQSSLFLTEEEIKGLSKKQTQIVSPVDSVILSATVGFRDIKNVTPPIILTFKKSAVRNATAEHNCHFWDPLARK